jgi:hypothetical protein
VRGVKKAGRVTAETARRITGISTPIGGIQWADPGLPERERVRHFILALEDRRALYNPMQLEVRGDVEHSLHALRNDCTAALQSLGEDAFALTAIRAIREACRRFHVMHSCNSDFFTAVATASKVTQASSQRLEL